ncbi:MAG TPA: tetratricopeptide repeat protein, partial [Roseiflexaceae bacterium]|nr:tetratricopeptide repeat protein [Roseiflexaceae bacterium]
VFAGGCTLEAAEQICAQIADGEQVAVGGARLAPSLPPIDVDVLDTIGSLVDKSLVRQIESQDETRFVMLETIREYAQLRLATSGETQPLRRQHVAYYLDFAERAEPELAGPQQAEWLDRLEDEHDNFRAALGWAIQAGGPELAMRISGALGRFWYARGYLTEGRNWLKSALKSALAQQSEADQSAQQTDLMVQAKALNLAGILAAVQIDYEDALACYTQSLEAARQIGDQFSIARALINLGDISMNQEDFAQAHTYYSESLGIFQALKHRFGIAQALHNLGLTALHQEDYPLAKHYLEEALALFKDNGDVYQIATLLSDLGELALAQRDYARSRRLYIESLELRRELNSRDEIADCLESLATVAGAMGYPERAACLGGAVEALREALGTLLAPSERSTYERAISSGRSQISEAAWAAAWAEGRTMAIEQAIALAKESLTL